ncbi:MAG TPA: FtsX-like permease family protein, partial [Steroidobacteraceae bacterium]|nr:FtsX-like permease family protein [Steroidobacteraceae bacterium]
MRLQPLDRKLLRDLQRLKMQAIAVSAVLACGVTLFVMATGMYDSLERARDHYYDYARMADIAVSAVRAPDSIASELEALAGVNAVETRVAGVGLLDIAHKSDPVSARFVSLPPDRHPRVNDVLLRAGRWPEATRENEVLINEAFAEANELQPGMRIRALIYGRYRELNVVGIASSPEFVFAVAPGGLLPEPARFGVVWMGRKALGRAFDLDGAFNDVVMRLASDADVHETMFAIDRMLARYGGRGAYGRDRMISAQFLADELSSLQTMASILPPIFMLVAVFLLNVSLSRLVETERSNIGLLKAFGYTNFSIALHYTKFAIAFAILGAGIGLIGGRLIGDYVAMLYTKVYRIPNLQFDAEIHIYVWAVIVALVAAILGAARAVHRAAVLPPAAALAPPAPVSFGKMGATIEDAAQTLDGKTRMVARRIARFPRRSLTTVTGIALALALLITSQHFPISMNHIVDVTFGVAQRMDATLTFSETADDRVLNEVARLPGVFSVEPLRATEVIFTAGSRQRRETLMGLPAWPELFRVLDQHMDSVRMRHDGITLSQNIATKLGVKVGDRIHVQSTEGHRATADLLVISIVKPYLAGVAYMEIGAMGRALREPGRVSGAYVLMDRKQRDALNDAVKRLPMIAGVSFTTNASASMRKMLSEGSGFFASLFVFFSCLMAGGVAYSAARVTFAEQERDLATLRVLGFRRGEVSYVLLAEIGGLLIVALPSGAVLGAVLSRWLMSQFQTDLFNFPYITNSAAYGRSALFV